MSILVSMVMAYVVINIVGSICEFIRDNKSVRSDIKKAMNDLPPNVSENEKARIFVHVFGITVGTIFIILAWAPTALVLSIKNK